MQQHIGGHGIQMNEHSPVKYIGDSIHSALSQLRQLSYCFQESLEQTLPHVFSHL